MTTRLDRVFYLHGLALDRVASAAGPGPLQRARALTALGAPYRPRPYTPLARTSAEASSTRAGGASSTSRRRGGARDAEVGGTPAATSGNGPRNVLVIVESPAKARTISGLLKRVKGGRFDGYEVHACNGHVRNLVQRRREVPQHLKEATKKWEVLGVDVVSSRRLLDRPLCRACAWLPCLDDARPVALGRWGALVLGSRAVVSRSRRREKPPRSSPRCFGVVTRTPGLESPTESEASTRPYFTRTRNLRPCSFSQSYQANPRTKS